MSYGAQVLLRRSVIDSMKCDDCSNDSTSRCNYCASYECDLHAEPCNVCQKTVCVDHIDSCSVCGKKSCSDCVEGTRGSCHGDAYDTCEDCIDYASCPKCGESMCKECDAKGACFRCI